MDFELRTSQLIAIYHAIISHYEGSPAKQEQAFKELVAELRKAIMEPP